MTTVEKMHHYREALRKWKTSDHVTNKEPQPADFGLKSNTEKFMARTIREEELEP